MASQPGLGTPVMGLVVLGQRGLCCDPGPTPVTSLSESLAAGPQGDQAPGATKTAPLHQTPTHTPFTVLWLLCCGPSGERGAGSSPRLGLPCPRSQQGVCCRPVDSSSPHPGPLFQGPSRPIRSLSTAQLMQPLGGLQASVISNIVLMKGQAKVSKDCGQQKLLGRHGFLRSCHVTGRVERGAGDSGSERECSDALMPAQGGAVRVALHCAGHRKTNVAQFFPGVVLSRS